MGEKLHILVVEGDPSSSFLLCMQLEHLGHTRVTLSHTFADADEQLHTQPRPELMLIDLQHEHAITAAPLVSTARRLGVERIVLLGRDPPSLPAAYDTSILLNRPAGMSELIDALNLAQRYR